MTTLAERVADLMTLRRPGPVNEDELLARKERGAKAEELMRNGALQDAFVKLEEAYVNLWRTTDPDEYEVRERAWTCSKVLEDLRTHLISTVRDGVVAQREIERTLRR